MEIRVAGHQVETGDALRARAAARLEAISERYFQRAVAANVTFGRGPYEEFTCDIVAPVAQGLVLKASNRASDAHVAFEGAADKIERQIKRYVDRLRERRGAAGGDEQRIADNAAYRLIAEPADEAPQPPAPAIVAETRVDIPEASVGDAVMMLDLRNTNALMFRNSGTGAFNMVYRRGDGTIGWVEPSAP